MRADFTWSDLRKDVREFVHHGLHCIITRAGDSVPRKLATVFHGQKPNEVFHMDLFYVRPAKGSKLKYILILRDDINFYNRLIPRIVQSAKPP